MSRLRCGLAGDSRSRPQDPLSANEPVPNYLQNIGRDVNGFTAGIIKDYFDKIVSKDVKKLFTAAFLNWNRLGLRSWKLRCLIRSCHRGAELYDLGGKSYKPYSISKNAARETTVRRFSIDKSPL